MPKMVITHRMVGRATGVAGVFAMLMLSGCDPVQSINPHASALSATGTPSAKNTTPAGAQAPAPQFTVKVDLSGAVTGSAQYAEVVSAIRSDATAPTCEQLAQKGFSATGASFTVPGGDGKAMISGFAFMVGTSFSGYHGPGTYHLTGDNSSISAGAFVDQSSAQEPFGGDGADATINSDGSGTFSFSGWKDSGGRQEGASVTWACQQSSG